MSTPERYAIDADGRLFPCRGRWRARAVAVVVIKRKPEAPRPYVPGQKISLKGAPSGMERMAEQWRRKAQ